MKGKLIVLYGINNLGKSTQAKKLVVNLQAKGIDAEYLKYPLYELVPYGPLINEYLRNNNPNQLSAREFQLLQLLNKLQFQPVLEDKLRAGKIIIAEDYKGTSLAWGMGAGVDEEWLKQTNAALLEEDLVFLFDGERFMESVEGNHKHEQDPALMDKVREAHLKLGEEFGWILVDANKSIDEIHDLIVNDIKKLVPRS